MSLCWRQSVSGATARRAATLPRSRARTGCGERSAPRVALRRYSAGMTTYEGSCHCERVRFRVHGELTAATVCNCSMCTKKGFLHWIVEPRAFELLAGRDDLVTYRFNTGVAEHKFCSHCGIHAFYTPRSDPDKVDVNVRCLQGV